MSYEYRERKIVCVVSDALLRWQAMNVVGHLAVSLGANKDAHLTGREVLVDASGVRHKGIARYGFIIKQGDSTRIRAVLERGRESESVAVFDFPREMLDTSHDDELHEAIAGKQESDLKYLGVLFYGLSADVDALTKEFGLWG